MILYRNDTRDKFIERNKDNHLFMAKLHSECGNNLSMWIHLLTWVQAEEIYGDHWDKIAKEEIK